MSERTVFFEILGDLRTVETIAKGVGVDSRKALKKKYGSGTWRKMKGTAQVRLANGNIRHAEVHWYEAHGIGRREFKIKKFID